MMNNVEQALSIINQYDSGEITFDKHANMLDELNLSDIEIEKLNAELNKDVEPLDGDGFHTTIAIHLFQCFVTNYISGKINIHELSERIENDNLKFAYTEFRRNNPGIAKQLDEDGINPTLVLIDSEEI